MLSYLLRTHGNSLPEKDIQFFLGLWWDYVPINPSPVGNIIKSKMHWIHLIYWTFSLSLAYLECAQNICISPQLGKIIEHKAYFVIRCRIFHVIYWIRYWKWNTERLSGYKMRVRGWDGSPWGLCGWLGAGVHCHSLASQERVTRHIYGSGKNPNSKFKVWYVLKAFTSLKSPNGASQTNESLKRSFSYTLSIIA